MDGEAAQFPGARGDDPASDQVARLRSIVERRNAQVLFRLANLVLIVACYGRYAPLPLMSGVGGAYICIQLWERYGVPRLVSSGRPLGTACALLTMAVGSALFGLPAVLWGVFGGPMGLVCGAFLLSGSILNSVVITRSCPPAFLATAGPFLLYIPLIALIAGGERLDPVLIGSVAVAGCSMSVSAIQLWRVASKVDRSESEALNGLRQRELELASAFEKAKAASRAKSDFLANMSHELRTPLNAILGFSEVMMTEAFGPIGSPLYGDYSKHIHQSGHSLNQMITDVLEMAHLDSGRVRLDRTDFPVADAMEAAVLSVSQAAIAAQITIETEPYAATAIHADRNAMTKILAILLNNGVKYTPAGGTVTVRSRIAQGMLALSVEDTGVGIPPEALSRLGNPFEQADLRLSNGMRGSGLGLAIARSLVELHGGVMRISSKPDVGTTVLVQLPGEVLVRAPLQVATRTTGRPPRLAAPAYGEKRPISAVG